MDEGDVRGDCAQDEAQDEEAAQAVLSAVFLTAESVDRLADRIPFARETSDLQLRLVVNAEPNSVESFLCPFGDVVYIHGFVRCLKGPFEANVVVL